MLRSLYTAGSGLNSQQLLLDTIANNLANVNTTGYKKNRVNFQDLIYQKMQIATKEKPVQVEVGTGVRLSSTLVDFKQGILRQTEPVIVWIWLWKARVSLKYNYLRALSAIPEMALVARMMKTT